jgi:hypothetical protein
MHFTATCHIPPTSSAFKLFSIKGTAIVELPSFTPDLKSRLRTLITAAAGTELADPYSQSTFSPVFIRGFIPLQKQFTTRRAVFLHAAWLVQASAH